MKKVFFKVDNYKNCLDDCKYFNYIKIGSVNCYNCAFYTHKNCNENYIYCKNYNIIDNFEQISKLLTFETTDDFYIIEIIKRKKDNSSMLKSEKLLDVYEIGSIEDLEKHKTYIIEKCTEKNARAYIRLNKRSHKKVALEMLRELANRVANDDYNIRNIYHSTMGKYHSDKNKKWIIDLDGDDVNLKDDVLKTIIKIRFNYHIEIENFYYEEIPTKNGIHLIVYPFDLAKFKKIYPNIDIHKDNPTILYFNPEEK